jgi:hypothetical protein
MKAPRNRNGDDQRMFQNTVPASSASPACWYCSVVRTKATATATTRKSAMMRTFSVRTSTTRPSRMTGPARKGNPPTTRTSPGPAATRSAP